MSATSSTSTTTTATGSLSKTAVIWIVLLGVAGIISLCIALFFVFRYSCTRKSRAQGHRILDKRNEHKEWWKHAHPPVDGAGMEKGVFLVRRGTLHDENGMEMMGLRNSGADMGTVRDSSWPLGYGEGTGEGEKGQRVKSRFLAASDLREEKV